MLAASPTRGAPDLPFEEQEREQLELERGAGREMEMCGNYWGRAERDWDI
jgi:hypothetical protein